MRAWREKIDAEMEAIQARTKAIRAKTEAMRDKRVEANLNPCRKETMACQETTEANPEMESESERREVPMEEAAVKSSGTMKKRQMSRHLAAGRRGEQKELTRGDCGSRRKLAAAFRKVSRPCSSGMTQENCRQERCDQEPGGMWSPAKTERHEETVEVPGLQQWHKLPRPESAATRQPTNKGPRGQMATISDEGKDNNSERHRRVEIIAAITSGKRRNAHEGSI
jgi:hypothetical protein